MDYTRRQTCICPTASASAYMGKKKTHKLHVSDQIKSNYKLNIPLLDEKISLYHNSFRSDGLILAKQSNRAETIQTPNAYVKTHTCAAVSNM